MEPLLLDFIYARDEEGLVNAIAAQFLTIEKSELVIKKLSPAFSEEQARSIVSIFYDLKQDVLEETVEELLYDINRYQHPCYYLEPNCEGRTEYNDTLPYIYLGSENIYFIKPFKQIR